MNSTALLHPKASTTTGEKSTRRRQQANGMCALSIFPAAVVLPEVERSTSSAQRLLKGFSNANCDVATFVSPYVPPQNPGAGAASWRTCLRSPRKRKRQLPSAAVGGPLRQRRWRADQRQRGGGGGGRNRSCMNCGSCLWAGESRRHTVRAARHHFPTLAGRLVDVTVFEDAQGGGHQATAKQEQQAHGGYTHLDSGPRLKLVLATDLEPPRPQLHEDESGPHYDDSDVLV